MDSVLSNVWYLMEAEAVNAETQPEQKSLLQPFHN